MERLCTRKLFHTIGFVVSRKWMENLCQSTQDWYFSLHPFSDVFKFDGVFSLKMHNRSIDPSGIRISLSDCDMSLIYCFE